MPIARAVSRVAPHAGSRSVGSYSPDGFPCFDASATSRLRGSKVIERQRAFVAFRKAAGHDTLDAGLVLRRFEDTLAIFEEDYRAFRAELEHSK
jgi:hypothetical protein